MSLTKVSYSMITGAFANVLDYGSNTVPGTTDMTAAFQACVAANPNITIYVPTGTYLVTDTIIPTGSYFNITGDRAGTRIYFKPSTSKTLIDASAIISGIGIAISNIIFQGTDYYFDPNKTPLIRSQLLSVNTIMGTRLRIDDIGVYGFNADYVVTGANFIESYITRSFFFGPYYSFGDSVGPTTTRTSSCFLLDAPANTTTHFTDCFIQNFKYAVEFVNCFSCHITRTAMENNFISVVSRKNGGTGAGLANTVLNCYFEANTYSLGGAGLAADYSDISNTAKWAALEFIDCYFNGSFIYGGSTTSDQPNVTYGSTIIQQAGNGAVYRHLKFLSSQSGTSLVQTQFNSFMNTDVSLADGALSNTGFQMGLPRNITNAGYDKQFRVVLKKGVGVVAHASWVLLGNGKYDNGNPVSDSWDDASSVIRAESNGGVWITDYTRNIPITVGALPGASSELKGQRGFVTDSNAAMTAGIGAVVAAGGANNVPVYCDGTNWRIG